MSTILSVAHYGHPLLKGVKHWAFLFHQSDGRAISYQITGSTNTYELKEPDVVEILKSQTYLGKVAVGRVEISKQPEFFEVLRTVPVVRGNLQWNCQNWIVDAMRALRENGFAVDDLTREDLANKLQLAKRED